MIFDMMIDRSMISDMMIKLPTHQSIAAFRDFPFALASDGLVCLVLIRG